MKSTELVFKFDRLHFVSVLTKVGQVMTHLPEAVNPSVEDIEISMHWSTEDNEWHVKVSVSDEPSIADDEDKSPGVRYLN